MSSEHSSQTAPRMSERGGYDVIGPARGHFLVPPDLSAFAGVGAHIHDFKCDYVGSLKETKLLLFKKGKRNNWLPAAKYPPVVLKWLL